MMAANTMENFESVIQRKTYYSYNFFTSSDALKYFIPRILKVHILIAVYDSLLRLFLLQQNHLAALPSINSMI